MKAIKLATAVSGYFALVLVLGGSASAGFVANAFLQVLGIALIGWMAWRREPAAPLPNRFHWLVGAIAVLVAVQFVPLPPVLWSSLPGRSVLAEGYRLLGLPMPWLTISLSPWATVASLTSLIPATALFLAVVRRDGPSAAQLALVAAGVAIASIAIGAMQRSGGLLYFYSITNRGLGVGFFANANHQASFLLATMCLWTARHLARDLAHIRVDRRQITVLVYYAVWLLFIIGVILSSSLAGYGLLIVVLAGTMLLSFPRLRSSRIAIWGTGALIVSLLPLIAYLGSLSLDSTGEVPGMTRFDFLTTGLKAGTSFLPFGSGLGTFEQVYHWFEDGSAIGRTYVNHAHNDYLELCIEAGLLGVGLIIVFLAWYLPAAWSAWFSKRNDRFHEAAALMIGILLLHSLVDYPLRTAAMSAFFAIGCALLLRRTNVGRSSHAQPHSREHSAPAYVEI